MIHHHYNGKEYEIDHGRSMMKSMEIEDHGEARTGNG